MVISFYKLNLIIESQEEESILIPRRSKEERERNYALAIQRQIQQYIKQGSVGNLDLSNTPITSLPDNLTTVNGDLSLYNTPITYLPDNLTVNGSLDLYNTPITSLPDNLRVNGYLNLINTPIIKKYSTQQLKDMLPGVKGRIYG